MTTEAMIQEDRDRAALQLIVNGLELLEGVHAAWVEDDGTATVETVEGRSFIIEVRERMPIAT